MFSGSYDPDDVTFLLKPVRLEPTPVAEKERLIQSGRRHYSEMLSQESLPSAAYLSVFHDAMNRNTRRLARDVLRLARHLTTVRSGPITLLSLARAGTPIGVVVARALRRRLGRAARHYSVSIIRDRGIDANALRHVLQYHAPDSIVFLDGWTGKGVIARELRQTMEGFNRRHGLNIDAGLFAVADLCGAAAWAATSDDYLIPSSLLGATISGLVSRSILNDAVVGPRDWHGCVFHEEFARHDRSRWFVDQVEQAFAAESEDPVPSSPARADGADRSRAASAAFLDDMRRRFGVSNVNFVKPGLGEATRVLLRRVPERVLVRDPKLADVAHLLVLAREKNVPVEVDPALPYLAAALIKELEG